jgi:hypothetical protein
MSTYFSWMDYLQTKILLENRLLSENLAATDYHMTEVLFASTYIVGEYSRFGLWLFLLLSFLINGKFVNYEKMSNEQFFWPRYMMALVHLTQHSDTAPRIWISFVLCCSRVLPLSQPTYRLVVCKRSSSSTHRLGVVFCLGNSANRFEWSCALSLSCCLFFFFLNNGCV